MFFIMLNINRLTVPGEVAISPFLVLLQLPCFCNSCAKDRVNPLTKIVTYASGFLRVLRRSRDKTSTRTNTERGVFYHAAAPLGRIFPSG